MEDITRTGVQTGKELQKQNSENFNVQDWVSKNIDQSYKPQYQFGSINAPKTYTPEELGTGADFGESRYDIGYSIDELQNYQDIRGNSQSGIAKLGSGIGKGIALAGTTFLDGTLGLLYGVGQGLVEGRVSALWDNDVSNALQTVNQELERILPNYRTQEEQEKPWYQNIGTMNFWADSVIKNLGFTVGAFYSGGVWTKGLKAIGALNKGLSASVVGSLMSGLNEGRIEANNGQRDFLKLQNAQIDDAYNQRYQAIFESGLSDNDKALALAQLDTDTEALRQDALERAHSMGLTTLIGNTIILTASNMWQFGKLYSRGFANHANVKAAAKAAGKEAPTIMEEGARLKAADDMMSKIGNRYVAKTTSKGKAILRGASNGLAEGFEEMNQQWIQSGAGEMYSPDSPDAYYEALLNHNSQVSTQDFLTGMAKGFTESYGDGSQWEQFAVGALTGLFGMPTFGRVNNADANTYLGRSKAVGISGGIFGEIRNAREQSDLNKRTADVMNKYLDKIEEQTSHFVQGKSFTNAMDGFAAEKNRFEYQNASDNDDFAAVAAFATAGRLNDLKDIINQDFENISDEELASIARNTTPDVTVNEEGNVETKDANGNILTGGWRAADGTLLSDTEEGRRQMKEELVKKRDKMIKAVNDYEQSVNLVRGIANNSLNDDQINELAWLHWKGKQFTDRYNSIKGEQGTTLQRLRQIANEISEAPFENNRDVLLTDLQNKYNDIVADRQNIEEALNLYTQEEVSQREALKQAQAQLEQLKGVANARESVIDSEQQRRINAIEKSTKRGRQKKLERAQNLQQIAAAMSEQKSRNEQIQNLETTIANIMARGKEASRKKLDTKKRLAIAKQAEKDAKHEYDMVFYNDDTESMKSLHESQTKAASNLRDFLDYLSAAENPITLASRIEANEKIVNALSNPVIKAILQSRMGEDGENIDKFLESLQDTAKIARAAKDFNERFEEFRKNPLNLQKRRNKIQQKAEVIRKSREDSKKRKTIENASVSELVNSDLDLDDLEGVLGSDTPEDGVTTIQGESKQKVKTAKAIVKQVSNMETAIDKSNASEQTKKDAKTLLNNSKLVSEDLEQLGDLSSEAYNDPSSLEIDNSIEPEKMQEAMQQRVDEAKNLLSEMQAAVSEQNAEDDDWITKWGAEIDSEMQNLMDNMASIEEVEAAKAERENTTGHDGVEDGPSIQEENAAKKQAEEAARAAIQNPMRAGTQAEMILDEIGLDKKQYYELAVNMVKSFYDMTKQGVTALEAIETILSNKDFNPITQNTNSSVALQNFILRWQKAKAQQAQVAQAQQETPREIPTPEISQESVDRDKNTDNTRITERNDQSLAENTLGKTLQYWKPTTTLMPIHSIGRGRKFYSKEFLDTTRYPENVKKRIQAIGEYLEKHGTFDRIDRGEVQKGDEVHFIIDSALNAEAGEIVILMADKEGNIIGDVMSLNDAPVINQIGLSSFIARMQKEYQEAGSPEHFVSKEVSEVDKRLIGKVPYSTQSHTLNEVHTDNGTPIPFKLGVAMSSGRMSQISTSYRTTSQGQSEEERQILPPLSATAGQPYLIMPTGDTKGNNRFITVPFIMDKFGPNNMNTQLGQAIQAIIRDIIKGDNSKAGSLRSQIEELLSADIHINYDGQGNLWIRLGEGEQARTIFDSRNNNSGILNNLTEDSTNDLVRQISLGLQGIPFQVNRKYINSTYKGQDYNRMIGEIATINLGIGDTHTISNWFSIKPLDENGNTIKPKTSKTTGVNPNAANNRLISIPLSDGGSASVNLVTKEVYINGNLYTEDATIRDKYLAHAYGIQSGQDMNKSYQSEWGYYNPITFKFEEAPTFSPVSDTSMNTTDMSVENNPQAGQSLGLTLGAGLVTPQSPKDINTSIVTDEGQNVKVSIKYDNTNTLKDRLANTHFNSDGSCIITINDNITLDQFFNYILGIGVKEGENTPQAQKLAVLNRLKEQLGITEETIKEIINTPEKAKELLLEHELSHVKHGHKVGYFDENEDRNNPNYLTETKISREYEATLDALRRINTKYAATSITMAESMYGGYFEGGGAIIEDDYHIDRNDAEAVAAINAFENAYMEGIMTNDIARNFLEVIKKYSPEQYERDKKTFLENTRARQEEEKRAESSTTSSRPQEQKDTSQSNLQKSNEDLAKARGFFNDATSKKAFEALTKEQQSALLGIQGLKAKQIMMQLRLHFKVKDNTFNINVNQLLGLEGKYRVSRDTSLDSKPFDLEKDLSKELRWLTRVLPQFSKEERIQLVKGLMTMEGNNIALGMFKNGIIYLNSETQRRGTVYHEAFHAVFDTLLSEEERQVAYNAAREQFGNLDTISLEERLAEDFRQYAEYEEYVPYEGLRGKVVKFWRKLKRMVNHLLGKDTAINALFYNINRGKLSQEAVIDRNTAKNRIEEEQEMQQIKDEAIANGTFMKAPNGNPTKLNEKQWLQVRTKAFKNWFGDWLNPTIFTANNVDDVEALEQKYPSKLPNKFYHHSTNKFGKQAFDSREGNKEKLHIIGRLTTDKVDVLVVENPNSENKISHITLATAEGVKPFESNRELENNQDKIQPLDDYVDTTFTNNLRNDVSKVVDENGEPLVVYHGSDSKFTVFDIKNREQLDLSKLVGKKHFFSSEKSVAKYFARDNEVNMLHTISMELDNVGEEEDEQAVWDYIGHHIGKTGEETKNIWFDAKKSGKVNNYGDVVIRPDLDEKLYEVFLNIKNPLILDANQERADKFIETNEEKIKEAESIIIKNIDETVGDKIGTDYIVSNSNQIKSATDNVGTFSPENNDIRYRKLEDDSPEVFKELKKVWKAVNDMGNIKVGETDIKWLITKKAKREDAENRFFIINRATQVNRSPNNPLATERFYNADAVLDVVKRRLRDLGIEDRISFIPYGNTYRVVLNGTAPIEISKSIISNNIEVMEDWDNIEDFEMEQEYSLEFDRLDPETQMELMNEGISQDEYEDMSLVEKEFLINHCR
jgi:hypothetical protein